MPLLDSALLEVLVCPQCHGALQVDEANAKLRCEKCGLAFPVEDGIPIMLLEEAEKIATNEK
jgi:uncharacterized protein YbaR (Trm112 family)